MMKVNPLCGLCIILFFLVVSGCKHTNIATNPTEPLEDEGGELLFQSGFEGTSKVVKDLKSNDYGIPYEYLTGIDNTLKTKNDWEKDWKEISGNGVMQVQYTGGDSTKRFIKVAKDPTNPKNQVLHFWLNDAWLASEGQIKARTQTNIYAVKGGFKELYQSVRVFLTEDFRALESYPHKITWCTISEFWNNEWWVANEPYGFRITLGLGKTADENKLHFKVESEVTGQKLVWKADHTIKRVEVPIGKWFTMDFYFKEGDKETGRFYLAITPDGEKKKVVYDVHDFTHNPADPAPDGLTGYNPMKLYTSKDLVAYEKNLGKTLQIYWDDFKLWKNKRPQ
ncbi:MAG: hypothetical protein H7Y04_00490 [Verrucomicrobia bacterium]|nr:hypothetical protein [Cytophagales bacterium]